MAQQTINIGAAPDDGTGDTLRDGGDKINDNFTELYGAQAVIGETIRDALGAALVGGSGITVTVDDPGDTITIAASIAAYTDEQVRDAIGSALVAGAGVGITVDDTANTITIGSTVTQYTDEMARDALGAALTAGAGITITPSDGSDTITITANAPINVKSFGALGNTVLDETNTVVTAGADETAPFQAAIDDIDSRLGGTLFVPDGGYIISSYLTLCKNLEIVLSSGATLVFTAAGGGGANASEDLRNGSLFYSNWPSNASTPVHIKIRGGKCIASNPANEGAGFYDNGGSIIELDTQFGQFKYGPVLDQSELVTIGGNLSPADSGGAGLWIVNGATLRAGNVTGVTNGIEVLPSTQINAGATVTGILDDGGEKHTFDGNFNGCLHHIRVAGVLGLEIRGKFESAVGAPVTLETTASDGHAVGQCDQVLFHTPTIIPAGTNQCVSVAAAGTVTFITPTLGNTTSAKVTGTGNINTLFSFGAINGGGGATFDGTATHHYEAGNNGTSFAIKSNLAYIGNFGATGDISTSGGTISVSSDGTNGGVTLNRATSVGFIELFNPGGVRQGYMGFLSGTLLELHAEGSATGWKVTGDLQVTGSVTAPPKVQSVTSSATVTPTFSNDQVNITAQAAGLTLANWSGTAVPAWGMAIRIKDNGTSRSIAYGSKYRAIGVTLPTATVVGKTLYLGVIYNSTDDKFDVVAVAQEA